MNVLLIGDSIRCFYCEEVKKELGENYNVYFPDENCRFASYVLNSLRYWLPANPVPDIIHFNAGLWDIATLYREDGCFTPKEIYVSYMKKILRELKKTGAKIIFATTTPVHDDKQFFSGPMPPAHKNADIIEYNKAVLEAFKDEDIIIDDLFEVLYPKKEQYLSDDMIHPNAEGIQLLSRAVSDSIRSCGNVKNSILRTSAENIELDEKHIQ